LTDAVQLDCANRNALSQGIDSEESRGHWARTLPRDLIGATPICACHHSKYHLTAAMTDLFKFAVTRAHAVTSKSSSRLHCSYGQSPQASPILLEGENGKKITLNNAGEFGKFTVDPDVVTLAFANLGVRFNHPFEVIDAAGRIHESIDDKARTGDLDALWKLVRTDMARLEMDAGSFRIEFQEGSIVRSVNQLDVRQPDLEQVDFWQPADGYCNSPMPKDPQHYPANLVE
jgi:hypothetical protein